MATLALIGLGSNLGDRATILDAAAAALAEIPGSVVRAVSASHETRPAGGPDGQGLFLNAAAAIETDRDPLRLLRALQEIEGRAGRVRTVRWGERTLDLDLLLFGDQIIRTTELTVPHPRLAVRRFVLAPAVEVAPGAFDPTTGRTMANLLANLDRRPSCVALAGFPVASRAELFDRLVDGLEAVGLNEPSSPGSGSWVDRIEADWDIGRWSASGDRWLVAETWLDAEYASAAQVLPEADRSALWSNVLAARGRIVRPTLVVAARGSLASRLSRPRPGDRRGSPLGDTPILVPESDDPAAVAAEVLAACAASRSG